MKVAVCVKQVPDTESDRKLSADFTLDRAAADGVLNELDEFAIEEALRIVEANGGDVTIVTMGPERAAETVRKALSMGADSAIHIVDDALAGSDSVSTAKVLAKALEGKGFDLILFGSESTDARAGVVPGMVSELLGVAGLTMANAVTIDGANVTIKRSTDAGVDTVTAATPAVISCVWAMNEPRYPSFKGIMAAKKKPVETLSLADLGLAVDEVGRSGAWSEVVNAAAKPAKAAGQKVEDAGTGGVVIADFLATNKLI